MTWFASNVLIATLVAMAGTCLLAQPRDFAFVYVFLFSVSFVGLVLLRTSLWRDYAAARRELQRDLEAQRRAEDAYLRAQARQVAEQPPAGLEELVTMSLEEGKRGQG